MTAMILLIAATVIAMLAVIFRQHKQIEELDDELNVTLANLNYFKARVDQMRAERAANIPPAHLQKRPKSMTAKRKKAE